MHVLQFHTPANKPDTALVTSLLRPIDAQPEVKFDRDHNVLEVISDANAEQVLAVLTKLGCEAQQLETMVHVSGGSTCCGSCGG